MWKRDPEETTQVTFSRVCWRRSNLGRTEADNLRAFAALREDWELTKKNIDQSKIRWVISTFKPFKSAGTDGIVPAVLQQGIIT
jgi:hypothetical protein